MKAFFEFVESFNFEIEWTRGSSPRSRSGKFKLALGNFALLYVMYHFLMKVW